MTQNDDSAEILPAKKRAEILEMFDEDWGFSENYFGGDLNEIC